MSIKPYSTKELISFYKVSRKTFSRWLKPHLSFIGPKEGYFYTAKQVTVIFERIGYPDAFINKIN